MIRRINSYRNNYLLDNAPKPCYHEEAVAAWNKASSVDEVNILFKKYATWRHARPVCLLASKIKEINTVFTLYLKVGVASYLQHLSKISLDKQINR